MRKFLLCLLLAGCENAMFATPDGLYVAERQFIQSEKEFALRSPTITLEAKSTSKVDAEAIRALGEQVNELAKTLSDLKRQLKP